MKHTLKKIGFIFCLILIFIFVLIIIGYGAYSAVKNDDTIIISNDTIINGPDEIVPDKASLIANLEDNGYTITEYNSVEGYDLTIDRIVAEKGRKFIDITYGLTDENAENVFNAYFELYGKDYYILAQNGNYVYCVSDKRTFSKAGFTSTSNIGVQYIND